MPLHRLLALALTLSLSATLALAETATLRRADGAGVTVRLSGDWSGGCPPTVILSHGLGGDEQALGWMDGAAAAAGYRVLVMAHAESGPPLLRRAFREGAGVLRDPGPWQARAADLDAAIAFATRDCRPRVLVLGGHSMGAGQTMFEAGARGRPPYPGTDRFDAYIAVSPQGLGWAFASRNAWRGVSKPVLMLTGTRDDGFAGETWEDRLVAFRGLPPGQKRLAVIAGATHFHLGGRGNRAAQAQMAAVAAEFLRHLEGGWAPSTLGDSRGIRITEK